MNKGWIEYDESNPPTDTSRGLHVRWSSGTESYWCPVWFVAGMRGEGRVVAYKYHDPYVEPEPEMPEVIHVFPGNHGLHVSTERHGTCYRRCVEMTPVLDNDGDLRCELCGEYSSPGDNFCPACEAEVKR